MTNTQTETEAVLSEMTPEIRERLARFLSATPVRAESSREEIFEAEALVVALGDRRSSLREEVRALSTLLKEHAGSLAHVLGEGHEARIARIAGVDRMTLRTWQGKPRSTKE